VRIHGLTGEGAGKMNGEQGTCQSWDAASNRWHVLLRSGEVKAVKPENLLEVDPDEPPLLEVWNRQNQESSAKAKAAQRILGVGFGESQQPLKGLDFTVTDLLEEAAKAGRAGSDEYFLENDPDDQLLSAGEDERVMLDDLDADLQLRK
ncbi:unnamed protein product, partial [Polarella glacialis]